ncbi:MAG: hypothetical protein ABWK00_01540 [Desulfurococcaceae archaeon]
MEGGLEQYVPCRSDCTLWQIEAYAMWGLVDSARLEPCRRRFARLVVKLFDGNEVSSKCVLEDEARQSLRIVLFYAAVTRRLGARESLRIVEGRPEE